MVETKRDNALLITGGRCVLDERELSADVAVIGRRIVEIGTPSLRGARVIDAAGCHVVAGFIDLHVHGGDGADFTDNDASAAERVSRFHARHGTTSLLASLLPIELSRLRSRIVELTRRPTPGLLGVHLEGPYVSPVHAGALDADHLRSPDAREFLGLVDGYETGIRTVTFAPELPGSAELSAAIRRVGAVPAVGHSAATYEQTTAAFDAGARHVTHLFHAMTGFHHRAPGVVGAALADPRISLELICDGVHVHPDAVRLLVDHLRARGHLGRLCLVTDAVRAAGRPTGPYAVGGRHAVAEVGGVRLTDGTLAGSVLTLDAAVRNVMTFAGLSLIEALALVTRNPARVLGEADLGTLRPGASADVVLLDEDLAVRATIRSGQVVFSEPESSAG